ncbi:hypothetical protein RJG79_07300 [Mycoplasmatota bacterium WC44]
MKVSAKHHVDKGCITIHDLVGSLQTAMSKADTESNKARIQDAIIHLNSAWDRLNNFEE